MGNEDPTGNGEIDKTSGAWEFQVLKEDGTISGGELS